MAHLLNCTPDTKGRRAREITVTFYSWKEAKKACASTVIIDSIACRPASPTIVPEFLSINGPEVLAR